MSAEAPPNADLSLQEKYGPQSTCFGCGPANDKGLHIRSLPQGDDVVATWRPQPQYEAFAGTLNGGIIGTLLDCHSNWTAAYYLMKRDGLSQPPCTVTAEYTISMRRPTPTNEAIGLISRVVSSEADRATVEAELVAGGKVTATCRGTFVAVQPGHPAYHRW